MALAGVPVRDKSGPAGLPLANLPDNGLGALKRLADGRVVVDVRVDDVGEGTQNRLKAAGADVLAVGDRAFGTITVSVADADLAGLSKTAGVQNLKEVLTPIMRACSPAISEGDSQLDAATARASFGVDGTGVTVGILSDSFDRSPPGALTNAVQDVAAGNLPGPGNPCGHPATVNTVADNAPGNFLDEGRAMAQTVHDLAPGATVAFATATVSETSFANNIAALAGAGAKVIVDDVGYFSEPFYQDGPISVAVNNARAAGVAYFSAAGNANMVVGGKSVGSYEAASTGGPAARRRCRPATSTATTSTPVARTPPRA